VKGHLRLAGVRVGRRVNDIGVDRRVDDILDVLVVVLVHRVRGVVVLAELPVETPPGIFVVRSAHD
jgi:hypothetical protein